MGRCFGASSLFVMLFIVACSPERNLARDYVKQQSGNGVMIIPLYELYKDNLSISYDTALKYTPDQFDSIAWMQSRFIKYVSDSLFLTIYTNSMINKLTTERYDVYLDGSSDIFLSLPDPKWVVQVAQLQINEKHTYNYYELFPVDGSESVTESLRINQVSLSSWFEVSRANTGNKQVLFLEGYIEDEVFRGVDFNLLDGNIGIEQIRDSLKMDDVYKMAFDIGQKHAELLFDYFMNDYIRDNLPPGIINRQYFHFDQKSKSLKKGLKEKFEVVK